MQKLYKRVWNLSSRGEVLWIFFLSGWRWYCYKTLILLPRHSESKPVRGNRANQDRFLFLLYAARTSFQHIRICTFYVQHWYYRWQTHKGRLCAGDSPGLLLVAIVPRWYIQATYTDCSKQILSKNWCYTTRDSSERFSLSKMELNLSGLFQIF